MFQSRELPRIFQVVYNVLQQQRQLHENNAKIYLDKAKAVCEKFKTPIFEFPVLVNNQYRLGGEERKILMDKS